MIEQIIIWWDSLGDAQLATVIMLFIGVTVIGCAFITAYSQDKRKTTTQKYREGLIKK